MSKLPAQPPVIRLRLEDASGAPLKDTGYVFEWREVPGHHVVSQTNADGVLTDEDRVVLELERHALHASELELDHPILPKRVRIEAPLPADLVAFWDRLEIPTE